MKRVAAMFTGGTLDSIGADRLDLAFYLEAGRWLDPGDLLASIPEVSEIAAVDDIEVDRLISHAMVSEDWLHLARRVEELARAGYEAVVIGHGTNTLEETAYFLHLALSTSVPVVFVGAMRPFSGLSSDASLNALNAFRVAVDPGAAGAGVVVVMNDTIFGARDATKTATYRVHAFTGGDAGPLGYVDADGSVVWLHAPVRRHTTATPFRLDDLDELPRVDVVVSHVEADGALIEASVAAGAGGIVVAGTGAGHPTPGQKAAMRSAVSEGVVVCQASRVGTGRVASSPGLEHDRIVAADNLNPWKARVLLQLALSITTDPEQIQAMFSEY